MQGSYPQRNDSRTYYPPLWDEFPSAVAPLEQTSSCVSLSAHSCPLSMHYKIILLNVYSAKIRILLGICLISLKLLRIFNEKRALTLRSKPPSRCLGGDNSSFFTFHSSLDNILFNRLNDIPHIIITDVRPCRQTHANLEQSF